MRGHAQQATTSAAAAGGPHDTHHTSCTCIGAAASQSAVRFGRLVSWHPPVHAPAPALRVVSHGERCKRVAPPRKAETQQNKEVLLPTQTTVDRHHSQIKNSTQPQNQHTSQAASHPQAQQPFTHVECTSVLWCEHHICATQVPGWHNATPLWSHQTGGRHRSPPQRRCERRLMCRNGGALSLSSPVVRPPVGTCSCMSCPCERSGAPVAAQSTYACM